MAGGRRERTGSEQRQLVREIRPFPGRENVADLDCLPKGDLPLSEPQPDLGAGFDDRRRCPSGMTGPLDALHGSVGRHPYLHTLAGMAPREDGEEMLDGRTDIVGVRLVPAGVGCVEPGEYWRQLGARQRTQTYGRHPASVAPALRGRAQP
jgi:hypothetical protein